MFKKAMMATAIIGGTVVMTGCGTMTGLPGHGGGKRFAVEQQLISGSTKEAIKSIDLSALAGKNVAVHISSIGDAGSGTLVGGRYALDALLKGEYVNSPTSKTSNSYGSFPSTVITQSGNSSSTTTADSYLNSPLESKSETRGNSLSAGIAVQSRGLGNYTNETLITNPKDITYLSDLVYKVMFLRGINLVPTAQADYDVFISVDVFGTIRDRTDWAVVNNERLTASTAFELFAVERATGEVVIEPTVASADATYQENYVLWMGPVKTITEVTAGKDALVSLNDIQPYGEQVGSVDASYGQPEDEGNNVTTSETVEKAVSKDR